MTIEQPGPRRIDPGTLADYAKVERERDDLRERVEKALDVAMGFGGIDGAHHKTWVIDQMVRALTGEDYEGWVKEHDAGDDGADTYAWDEGIAP